MDFNKETFENVDPELTGKFIKSIRKYHNLTQDELAENLYITRKAVSKWETGVGFPSIDVAKRFCDIYGVSFEELIAGKYIFKKREFIINSTLVTSSIIFFLLFVTLYSAYLNLFVIYKFSFEDKNINIVNNRLLVSNKYKFFDLGSVNKNSKNFKDKITYLEVYIKNEEKIKIFSCKYKFGKCKNRKINSNIKRKVLDENLDKFYLKVNYKNNKSKSVTLEKQVHVQKIEKVKNITKSDSSNLNYNNFNEHNYKNDSLLENFNKNATASDKIKKIDLTFLFVISKNELYKKFNNKKLRINNHLYAIDIYSKEHQKIITISDKYRKVRIDLVNLNIVFEKNNNITIKKYPIVEHAVNLQLKDKEIIRMLNCLIITRK